MRVPPAEDVLVHAELRRLMPSGTIDQMTRLLGLRGDGGDYETKKKATRRRGKGGILDAPGEGGEEKQ